MNAIRWTNRIYDPTVQHSIQSTSGLCSQLLKLEWARGVSPNFELLLWLGYQVQRNISNLNTLDESPLLSCSSYLRLFLVFVETSPCQSKPSDRSHLRGEKWLTENLNELFSFLPAGSVIGQSLSVLPKAHSVLLVLFAFLNENHLKREIIFLSS